MLFNRTACIPSPPNALLFTSAAGVSGMGLFPGGGGQGEQLLPPLNDVRHPAAVATLPSENLIFWIDQSQDSIYSVRREGDDRRVVASDLQSPVRLAVDWVSKLVFWTDNLLDVIEVADIAGVHRLEMLHG